MSSHKKARLATPVVLFQSKFAPVSQKQHTYYLGGMAVLISSKDAGKKGRILKRFATDKGLDALVPHFVHFVRHRDHPTKHRELRLKLAIALLHNKNMQYLHLYLDQMYPFLTSVLVNTDECWDDKRLAAKALAEMCERFGQTYPITVERTRDLYLKHLDSGCASTRFGGVIGLCTMGLAQEVRDHPAFHPDDLAFHDAL